jgi:hypothetical protein
MGVVVPEDDSGAKIEQVVRQFGFHRPPEVSAYRQFHQLHQHTPWPKQFSPLCDTHRAVAQLDTHAGVLAVTTRFGLLRRLTEYG